MKKIGTIQVLFVLAIAGSATNQPIANPDHGLEPAAKSNEFSQAIASRSLPNVDPQSFERAERGVPARNFDSAIAIDAKKTSQLEGSTDKPITNADHELELASKSNEFSQAIGTRSLPNADPWDSERAWRVVPARDFDSAIADETKKTSQLEGSAHFFDAAQVANDGWSAGVFVNADKLEHRAPTFVHGVNWVVVEDARIDPGTNTLFATRYRLVNQPLTFTSSFVGWAPAIFQRMGDAGTERCCGPEKICSTEGGPENPNCPGGFCEGNTQMYNGSLGAGNAREAAGFPVIRSHTYNKGTLLPSTCFPTVDPKCKYSTPICTGGVLENLPVGGGSADVPIGSGACGGVGNRPVTGRNVPKECLYRDTAVEKGASAGSYRRPECDGQCYDCEEYKPPIDANLRPRQCDLMRPMPGDPPGLPGSGGTGVCESRPEGTQLEQASMRRLAGVSLGMSGSGDCRTGEVPNPSGIGHMYVNICIECSPTQCEYKVKRAPNPLADESANKNTSTTCNMTEAKCGPLPPAPPPATPPPLPAKPPVLSTSPPPPQPNKPKTDRTEQPPAADPKPEAQQAVSQKSATTGDPIAVASGAFELRHVDLSFPGPVRPLEFVRTYHSRSRDRSVLGSNWSHNWDVRVVPLNDENRPSWADPYCAGSPHETTCIMLYVGGTPYLYYKEFMTGVFVPQAGSTATLVPLVPPPTDSAGTPKYTPDYLTGWLLESADGHNLTFDQDGYLTKDVNRFGNGFVIQYEPTPSGLLFMALCPRGIIEMLEDPRDNTRFTTRPQRGPVYDSDSLDCRALGSVVGVRAPFARQPSGVATLSFAEPQGIGQEFRRAKALVESLQNHAGRQPGAPMPWGTRLKRVTHVKEILATMGSQVTTTGRELQFDYYPDDAGPLPGTAAGLTAAGLLRAVRGPAGAQISFEYQSAESAASHPVFLNEAFLVQAGRHDGVAPAGLRQTPQRALRFTYAWEKNGIDPKGLTTALDSYRQFWHAQSNCTFTPVDNCSVKGPVAINIHDDTAALQDVEANFRAEVADNIIRVDNGPIVESETRYDVDPFSLSFDRAVRQRWGSTSTTAMASTAPDWDTQLPEATLAFSEALPINDGLDDVTTSFLPPAIAKRYDLEAFPPQNAFSKAQSSGMLLAPNSPDGTVIPNQNSPIAEGSYIPVAKDPRPACRLQKLPVLRTRLPGYRPSFEYYDLPAQTPDPDSATTGINVATFALKRSRLSCEVLARAQASDAKTTDLLWTWQNVNGQMVANRSLGRRQFITLNANRIYGWVREANRDGVVRYKGINFQGRPLVDAIQGDDSQWRFAETLYNADGNVIAQRRTLPESTPWSDGRGDTRYSYLDLVQPNAGLNPVQPLPWYWARRNNILKITDRPRGSIVTEYKETAGGTTTIETTGRFTEYLYEPIFNQVRKVSTGWINKKRAEFLNATTEVVYDYQEGQFSSLRPILERQRALGYDHETDTNLNLQMGEIEKRLGMALELGDLNGDGNTTIFGLPSLVYHRPAAGGKEVTTYRWNRGGRLLWVQSADGASQSQPGSMPTGGSITEFEYLPLGALNGATSPDHTGFVGTVHHVPRKSWQTSDGPSRAPCPHLAGPYQWLLPSTCSSVNLAAQIMDQHYVPKAVAHDIADQQALARDGSTQFQYYLTGQVERATGPDGRATEFERDVDGRVIVARLIDNGTEHSKTEITYDRLMHPVEAKRTSGSTYLGATLRRFDEESHLLFECDEFVAGGCAHASHGALPAAGVSRTYWYTPEGLLKQSQDAEGLLTTFTRDPRTWITLVETSNPNARQDGVRTEAQTHDDDGSVLTRNYGGVLWEHAHYDGYGRLIRTQDTQSRWVGIHRSPHENVVRHEIRETEFGPAQWYQWFKRDTFGRVLGQYVNGTSKGELVQEFKRRPGGAVWWSRSYGTRPQFMTSDADGTVVWSEDADAEIAKVTTGYPSTRHRSQTTIRGNGWMTTSVGTTLNVLGLAEQDIESGSGAGRPTLSRETRYLRNKAGFLLRQDDPDGKSTGFEYDLVGQMHLKREWVPTAPAAQHTSEYLHDRRGALTTIKDINGEMTSFEYNTFGQLRFQRSPSRSGAIITEHQYDFLGRLSRTTPGGTPGPQTTYERVYNAKNQLWKLTIDASATPLRDYTYDVLGRLSTATHYNLGLAVAQPAESPVVNSLEYDWLGRISLETEQIGGRPLRATASKFKVSRNLAWSPVIRHATRPDGSMTTEKFDSLGRMAQLTRGSGPASPTTLFAYTADLLHTQSSQASTGMVRSDIEFDALAQPLAWKTQVNGADAVDIRVLRDAAGRIGSYARRDWRPPSVTTPELTWRGYTYDSMRRVANIHEANAIPNLGGLVTHSFKGEEIDAAAATVAQTNGFNTWTYHREPRVGSVLAITSPNAPSRLTAAPRLGGYQLQNYYRGNTGTEPVRAVTHDEVGRVTSDGLDMYRWNILSELITVVMPIFHAESLTHVPSESRFRAEQLQYDGFGRLVARRDKAGQVVEEYAHDGDQMVAAWDINGSLQWSAMWGPGLDNLVSIRKGDDSFLTLHDGRGSIGSFINEATQRVAANSDYTPEGRTKWTAYSTTGSAVASCDQLSSPTAACNEGPQGITFGFHSAFKSPDTGLVYFRNRWLSSRTGEWLSRDTRGTIDSYNLYSLAAFDSVNYVDPFGLSKCGSATDGSVCGDSDVTLDSGNVHMDTVKKSSFDEGIFNQIIDQYSYKGEPTHDRFGYRTRSAWEEITSSGSAPAAWGAPGVRLACGPACITIPLIVVGPEVGGAGTAISAAALAVTGGAVLGSGGPISDGTVYGDHIDSRFERLNRIFTKERHKGRETPANATQNQSAESAKPKPQDQKPPGAQSTPATPPEPQKPPEAGKPDSPPKVEQIYVQNLVPTHGRTMSNTQFDKLRKQIKADKGIKEPIKYVEYLGRKYIVEGHHRALAAKADKMEKVPAQKVELPYGMYRTPDDLINQDIQE